MKENNKIYFLVIFVLILVLAISFISLNRQKKLVEIKEMDIVFNLTLNELGFNLNASLLDFGKIPLGGSTTRDLFIKNEKDYRILVKIIPDDSIKNYLSVVPFVVINPQDSKNVSATVFSSANSTYLGIVKGSIFLKIYKY